MARKFKLFFFLIIPLCLFSYGCAQNRGAGLQDETGATRSKKVYRGKIVAKSNRTETISIELGNGDSRRIVKVNFDDRTRGIDHAVMGKQVIVTFKVSGGHALATSIKAGLSGFAPGVSEISVKKVKKLIADGDDFTLIDSRPESQYKRSHLASAISIPSCEMNKNFGLLPEKKEQLLVFYCGGPICGMSTIGSATAANAGYKNIRVMLAGVEGWAEIGYPTYADDDFVAKGDAILIDLRAAGKNAVHRIAGSISIPSDTLDDRISDISKKATVVVYSDKIQESLGALAAFKAAGFTSVSMVEGNLQGWEKRNRSITSGSVVTEINWTRKTSKGEVSPAAFKKAMSNRIDAVILDVRTSDETAAGKLTGAKLVPLNELYERFEELPKDKKIYIYSATGARAEMAARLLKENVFDAYFLVADISCHDGNCEMEF